MTWWMVVLLCGLTGFLVSMLGKAMRDAFKTSKAARERRDLMYRKRECASLVHWLRREMEKATNRAHDMRILGGEERFERGILAAAPGMLRTMEESIEHGKAFDREATL